MADPEARTSPKLRVLVVDDDRDLAEVARTALELEGHIVHCSHDGRDALLVLDAVRPDVVLTDLVMPVLDGFGFLAEYAKRPEPRAPVIATSSLGPYLDTARGLGVAATLPKPYELEQLLALIASVAAGETRAEPVEPSRPDERRRLATIFDLGLDRPTPSLEPFATWVADLFEVPICLVSVITETRQYWTAGCGIPEVLAEARGGPRDDSFCTHAVAGRAALVVHDTLASPFFRDNVFVREHGFRFYAGVPLFHRTGDALGTLCIIDHHAQRFDHLDFELLCVLGSCVLAAIEHHERRRRPEAPASTFRYLEWMDRELAIFGRPAFLSLVAKQTARLIPRGVPITLVGIAPEPSAMERTARTLQAGNPTGAVARLGVSRLGWLAVGLDEARAREVVSGVCGDEGIVATWDLGSAVGSTDVALANVEQALGEAGLAPRIEEAGPLHDDALAEIVSIAETARGQIADERARAAFDRILARARALARPHGGGYFGG